MPINSKMIMTAEYGPVKIQIGDIVTFNFRAKSEGIAQPGMRAEIFCWHPESVNNIIGLRAYDPEYIFGWANLEGEVEDEKGWWIESDTLIFVTDIAERNVGNYVVSNKHEFRGQDLKGKECKLLAHIHNTDLAFVDFGEDIGGCAADGLGIRGHCLAVPTKILQRVKESTKSK